MNFKHNFNSSLELIRFPHFTLSLKPNLFYCFFVFSWERKQQKLQICFISFFEALLATCYALFAPITCQNSTIRRFIKFENMWISMQLQCAWNHMQYKLSMFGTHFSTKTHYSKPLHWTGHLLLVPSLLPNYISHFSSVAPWHVNTLPFLIFLFIFVQSPTMLVLLC